MWLLEPDDTDEGIERVTRTLDRLFLALFVLALACAAVALAIQVTR